MSHIRTLHLNLPVDATNDQSVTIKKFSQLTLAEQDDVIRHGLQYGDAGHEHIDTDYVPPYCRDGVTLPQLEQMLNKSRDNIKQKCEQLSRDQRKFGRSVSELLEFYD